MQTPPLSVIASWPPPNYVNPETRGPAVIIVLAIFLAIVTLLIAIRIYTRIFVSRGFGLDDVLIILAYIPVTAFAIIVFVAETKYGWDRHAWDVLPDNVVPSLKLSLASQLLFDLGTSLTKLSMLALIYRVLRVGGDKTWRYIVLALATIITADGLIFFFLTTFQCRPVQGYWTVSIHPQQCINEAQHLLAAGCINTATDFLIVLIPIPTVVKLKLPRKQLIVVTALFAGGVFATAAGAVRTFFTNVAFTDPKGDRTWNAYKVTLVTGLELFIGIICASIPATKPFFAHFLPRLLENPGYWLSNPHIAATSDTKTVQQPDFWPRMTIVDTPPDSSFRDVESPTPPSVVMQMREAPTMPGMPTPTRPPRTASTMRTFAPSASSPVRATRPTTAASISTFMSAGTQTNKEVPNLNKPLPRIDSVVLDESFEEAARDRSGSTAASRMSSVYQFIPYEDGHISVHKAKRLFLRGVGRESGASGADGGEEDDDPIPLPLFSGRKSRAPSFDAPRGSGAP